MVPRQCKPNIFQVKPCQSGFDLSGTEPHWSRVSTALVFFQLWTEIVCVSNSSSLYHLSYRRMMQEVQQGQRFLLLLALTGKSCVCFFKGSILSEIISENSQSLRVSILLSHFKVISAMNSYSQRILHFSGIIVSSNINMRYKIRTTIKHPILLPPCYHEFQGNIGRILLVPSVFGRPSSVFGRLEILFFWYCLRKTVGLEGLPNLLLCELEDFADFARILFLMCYLSDNLASDPHFQVGAYETFQKR